MKKKDLQAQLKHLVETLNMQQRELEALRLENEELSKKINEVSVIGEALPPVSEKADTPQIVGADDCQGFSVKTDILADEPDNIIDTVNLADTVPVTEAPVLSDTAMEYGSSVIGTSVRETMKYANIISSSVSDNKKELLNLIIGKGEILKSEIFNIADGDASVETKCRLMDEQLNETIDYFKSVVGQL